jgi:hypothetical protein
MDITVYELLTEQYWKREGPREAMDCIKEFEETQALPYVIAVDFDGFLFLEDWPRIGEPMKGHIRAAITAQAIGARIILWTCREGDMLEDAIAACGQQGLFFDAVNASLPEWVDKYGNDGRKIGYSELWDDRAAPVFSR